MKKLLAVLALLVGTSFGVLPYVDVAHAADCRGGNQFTGGHDGPPKHKQNVCTK